MSDIPNPKLYDHTLALYSELDKLAIVDTADTARKIFTGSRVEVFRSLGVSQAYYTTMFAILEEMNCVEYLHRGRSGQPSVMALYHAPTLNEWQDAYKRPLTKGGSSSNMESRVKLLEGRLAGIDLGSALVNFEERLTAIELQLRKADGEEA